MCVCVRLSTQLRVNKWVADDWLSIRAIKSSFSLVRVHFSHLERKTSPKFVSSLKLFEDRFREKSQLCCIFLSVLRIFWLYERNREEFNVLGRLHEKSFDKKEKNSCAHWWEEVSEVNSLFLVMRFGIDDFSWIIGVISFFSKTLNRAHLFRWVHLNVLTWDKVKIWKWELYFFV